MALVRGLRCSCERNEGPGEAGQALPTRVRLLLRRLGSSQTTRLVTFSDGGFYHLGVKPGEYELSELRLE